MKEVKETKSSNVRILDRKSVECVLPAIAGKGEGAYSWNSILVTEKETVATDLHMMLVVPLPSVDLDDLPAFMTKDTEGCNGDDFLLFLDDAKRLLKSIPKNRTHPMLGHIAIVVHEEGRAEARMTDLSSFNTVQLLGMEGPFPKYGDVMPNKGKSVLNVCMNVASLESIVKAAKKGKSDYDGLQTVNFYFPPTKDGRKWVEDSIAFDFQVEEGRQAEGVVMPYRRKEN